MIGIYFSGTGNSKHCIEKFIEAYDTKVKIYSIEDKLLLDEIKQQEELVFAYPVQYSNIPKIVHDFIVEHHSLWNGKKVFVIATMGLFSGDGSGILMRLLKKYGAVTIGGLHLRMPDSIGDEKALKKTLKQNQELVRAAEQKIDQAVIKLKQGTLPQEGMGWMYHLAGLFGQRLYFYRKTKQYSNKLTIQKEACVGCGKCVQLCPMHNIVLKNQHAFASDRCTMCYRCVNNCPTQAITLLGKKVMEQSRIEKYL